MGGITLSCENHPGYGGGIGWVEARALAKTYNLNYVEGKMTKTTICYLVDSYYDTLSFANASASRPTRRGQAITKYGCRCGRWPIRRSLRSRAGSILTAPAGC